LAGVSKDEKQDEMKSQQKKVRIIASRGHTPLNEFKIAKKGDSINHRYAQHYRKART